MSVLLHAAERTTRVLASESPETPLPTLISGDLALTSTPPKDGSGARAQVVGDPREMHREGERLDTREDVPDRA